MLIDWHLKHGLDNFNIEPFQSADNLRELCSELDFRFRELSLIIDDSYIFRTSYYKDIIICIHYIVALLPFQVHLNFELVLLNNSQSRRIYC